MFARWFYSRLRAGERAVRDGRLDDACKIAREKDFRADPRGQRLLDQLVKPLLARARLHRQAGRYADARGDLDLLAEFDRLTADAQALRQSVEAEMDAGAAAAADKRVACQRAADHLRAGRLDTVRMDLQRVDDTAQREELAEELDQRRQRGLELVQQARQALGRGDLLVAVRTWDDARRRCGVFRELDELAANLSDACQTTLVEWHRDGRLERLLAAQDAVQTLAARDPTLSEMERLIGLIRTAASQLVGHDYDGLRRTLLRIRAGGGEAAWLKNALGGLALVGEGQEKLLASPLGLLASLPGPIDTERHKVDSPKGQPAKPNAGMLAPAHNPALASPLLVLVDGGGSSLLVGADRVRLGRSGSSSENEVAFSADLEAHHAEIVRRDDEFYLTAFGPTSVNHELVRHTRLHDGDRIKLGARTRLVFNKPSEMSGSAVLRLAPRNRLAQDVSTVVLFRDTCLIGPDASCHIRTREATGRVVLFERAGELCGRLTAGEHYLSAPARALPPGGTEEFGEIRVTVKRYEHGR